MKSILTVTMNPAVDVGASVMHVYPEHKLRCQQVRNDPGGGGINVSRAIKKLGGDSTAMYFCGGPTGQMLRTLLDAEDLDQRPITTERWTRQDVTISEIATGQQYRFIMPGSALAEGEWHLVLDMLDALDAFPDFVVASGSLPPGVPLDFYGQLARLVRNKGSLLIVDTSGQPLKSALEAGVYLIKPSLRELKQLNESSLDHEADQEEAAMRIIHSDGCKAVVVSLGPAGVLLATPEGCVRMRSPNVPVRSKVGAGDSMVAGLALGLARDYLLQDAIRFGVAAGAAAVMNPGTELCRREDAEKLYDRMAKLEAKFPLAAAA
ncbi:MAG: 1-phosphofructokinase family hexose kinase [Methylacidiphilales bacterium]|nr:1-phosphofructokinase family hexose kinase [Candidatus Methylacidiphilales bacterium]